MIIEICANSFASAKAAQDAGAHRIELCAQLSVGGLTPSQGLIEKVVQELDIEVHVLIRPRAGDFAYSLAELDIMKRDITMCKALGCAGVVSGALTAQNTLDLKATKTLIAAAGPLAFTFHRAFDVAQHPIEIVSKLQALGVTRILSSGQQPKAIDGMKLLKEMQDISGHIQIMPGSGINQDNITAFKNAGFEMVHFSAISSIQILENTSAVSFQEGIEGTSDVEVIRKMISKISK